MQRRLSQQAFSLCACLLLGVVSMGNAPSQRTSQNSNQDSDVVASGEVRPIVYVKLTSDVPGRVKEIFVKIGDKVEDRQALFLIEKRARQPKDVRQYSPLAGIVADVSASVGQVVDRRTKPLMMIADMSHINVEIAVDELEIKSVRLGQRARVLVDAFSEKEVRGVVRKIRRLPLRSPGRRNSLW